MFLEILFAVLLGLMVGIFTGLFPGVHINLVAITLVSLSPLFLEFVAPITLASFLVAMAITHTFLDILPSIFLGVPKEETALSILPGHELLLQGRGYEAIRLSSIGSLAALFVILAISPLYIWLLPKYYPFFQEYMAFVLLGAAGFLILRDEKRLLAFFLFTLSGILGIFALSFTVIKQPLLPLLSGLFGSSLLMMSFIKKSKIPRQNFEYEERVEGEKGALASSILSGSIVSFLPGLGAAQGAVLGSSFTKLNKRAFLILLGAVSTITMGLGFTALYVISRPRHGVAVATGKILDYFTLNHLLLLFAVMLFSGGIAFLLTLKIGKIFASGMSKVNYRKLSFGVLGLIILLCILISGSLSLLVLVTGTAIGILCSALGVRKMHLMGCLILPVMLYFLV